MDGMKGARVKETRARARVEERERGGGGGLLTDTESSKVSARVICPCLDLPVCDLYMSTLHMSDPPSCDSRTRGGRAKHACCQSRTVRRECAGRGREGGGGGARDAILSI